MNSGLFNSCIKTLKNKTESGKRRVKKIIDEYSAAIGVASISLIKNGMKSFAHSQPAMDTGIPYKVAIKSPL